MEINKKINLELVGLDGNAFSLMSAFSHQAREEGWSKEEIDFVRTECMSGDYDNLLCTLMKYCESNEDDDYEDDYELDEMFNEDDY